MPEPNSLLSLYGRYQTLAENRPGWVAPLRRAPNPAVLSGLAALGPVLGDRPLTPELGNLLFLFPDLRLEAGGPSLGEGLARTAVTSLRFLRLMRTSAPGDMVALRRILHHLQPVFGLGALDALSRWETGRKIVTTDFFRTRAGEASRQTPTIESIIESAAKLPKEIWAPVRRATCPEDVYLIPLFYQLMGSHALEPWACRAMFLLPCLQEGNHTLGQALAARVARAPRVMQMARSAPPLDLIQLRRLIGHNPLSVNWSDVVGTLKLWDRPDPSGGLVGKRRLIDHFFRHHKPKKQQGA